MPKPSETLREAAAILEWMESHPDERMSAEDFGKVLEVQTALVSVLLGSTAFVRSVAVRKGLAK